MASTSTEHCPIPSSVSVPFTRGTPPWRYVLTLLAKVDQSFSPLHEGDTSVARARGEWQSRKLRVSVPFTRGTPPWHRPCRSRRSASSLFQSPSRGGHLRGIMGGGSVRARRSFSPLHEGDTSVAREKGDTTIDLPSFSPLHEGDTSVASEGLKDNNNALVSVPFTRGTPPWHET